MTARIKRITRAKGFGIFNEFQWDGSILDDFATRNLVYGWNYSGKTTFSRMFQCFESPLPPSFGNAKIKLELDDGSSFAETDQLPESTKIRVFNTDFVEKNVSWEGENGVSAILIVGKESISLEKKKHFYEHVLDRRNDYANHIKQLGKQLTAKLDDAGTLKAKEIRSRYGVQPFNRAPHLESLIPSSVENAHQIILSDSERKKFESILNSEPKQPHKPDVVDYKYQILNEKVSALLKETATQVVIKRLAEDPGVRRWVELGLSLHEGKTTCQFCEKTLEPDLLKRLGEYFSGSYKKIVSECDSLENEIEKSKISIQTINPHLLFEDFREEYSATQNKLLTFQRRINRKLDLISHEVKIKRNDVDKVSSPQNILRSREHDLLIRLIEKRNSIIQKHNKRCADLGKEKQEAKDLLKESAVAEFSIDINYWDVKDELDHLRQRYQENKTRIQRLESLIAQIDNQINDAMIGASELSRYLNLYFGKKDLEVKVVNGNRFKLFRGDVAADNLSEGEKTAIAFSYFILSLKEKSEQIENLIIYIDDPVSSLDANHVFNTFAIIKSELKYARQLFISTHNFDFFKMLRGDAFFKEFNKNKERRSSFYLIQRQGDQSSLLPLPEALRKYNSEYHFLFSTLYRLYEADGDLKLSELWLAPNLTRRLLEIFTSFRIPKTTSSLDQRLNKLCADAGLDGTISHQIYKFVNHFSHSDALHAIHEFPESAECKDIIDKTFKLINKLEPDHYSGMKDIACGN